MLVPEHSAKVLFGVLLLMLGTDSFHWTDSVLNDTVKYVCSGGDLNIPWNFAKEAGEDISQVQWYFRGLSEELVAILNNGNFIVMPSFSGRVRFTPEAGLQLLQVVPADAGNFSVVVSSHIGSGHYFNEKRTVIVKIGEPPSTDAGTLQLQQSDVAVMDNGQAHVQLTCGHFASLGEPPIEIVWRTPWGTTEPSTSQENGNFHYLLPNPFLAGQYTCSVSTFSAASVCLSESSHLLLTNTYELDVDRARRTLHNAWGPLRVNYDKLRQNLTQLEGHASSLARDIAEMENNKNQLTQQLTNFRCSHNPNSASGGLGHTTTFTTITTTTPSPTTTTTRTTTTTTTTIPPTTTTTTTTTTTPTPTTTTTPQPTTPTTTAPANDPCMRYTQLEELNRLNQNQSGGMCDAYLREGWYRFRPNANDDGYIPTSCVTSPSCSTAIPIWMDLEGQSLPQRNQEITVRVYGATEQGGCHDRTQMPEIKVRRCDQYFVYYLYPTSCTFGKSAYCVTTTAP